MIGGFQLGSGLLEEPEVGSEVVDELCGEVGYPIDFFYSGGKKITKWEFFEVDRFIYLEWR